MMQEVKIAGSRMGVLIGKGGATKKELETKTHTTITIDSKEGIVKVEGTEEHTIPLLRAVEIINAINRGFSPERAFEMIEDEDLLLEVIDLAGMADSPRQLDRLRGRIIGKDGRAREQIEDMTDVEISVFGKTVALIGYPGTARRPPGLPWICSSKECPTRMSLLSLTRRRKRQNRI